MDDTSFAVLEAAFRTKYFQYEDVIKWADAEIAALDSPPKWLLDLSFSTDEDIAAARMNLAMMQKVERCGRQNFSDETSRLFLYLGFLWLGFEKGNISADDLLRLASDELFYWYEDGDFGETLWEKRLSELTKLFYQYLDRKIDCTKISVCGDSELAKRARRVFMPFAEFASQLMCQLPDGLTKI